MSNETDNNDSLAENTENSEGTVGQQGASGSAGDVMVAEHDRPSVLHVIPVYDRPVLPSEVLPVQLAGKWGETIRQVINGDD